MEDGGGLRRRDCSTAEQQGLHSCLPRPMHSIRVVVDDQAFLRRQRRLLIESCIFLEAAGFIGAEDGAGEPIEDTAAGQQTAGEA